MFERQRNDLAKAILLLNTIKADPERLDVVLELQRHLIRRITRTERRITRVNRASTNLRRSLARDRLPKEQAKQTKTQIARCIEVIEGLRHQLFVWRCFGDGIAAIYQSKYALKHLYYDAAYRVKEDAGFMTGKSGFRREWKFLKMGVRMGVPVVLADVTNVVRHGDLCALAGPDPMPIEVKSSKNRNARSGRQIAQLHELAAFYANDGAESFRGVASVRRMELRTEEVTHETAINDCMAEALRLGFSTIEPEPGLRYVAFTNGDLGDHCSGLVSPTVQPYVLLPSPSWLPAYPFTLSLTPTNLVEFLLGHIAVLVLIDLAYLKSLIEQHGVHATMMMDSTYAIQVCKDPTDLHKGAFRVSLHRFGRIAGEFQSLAWFAEETARSIEEFLPSAVNPDELAAMNPDSIREIPPDWYTVRDCFDIQPSILERDVHGRLP